jgi:HEAT repeat protein
MLNDRHVSSVPEYEYITKSLFQLGQPAIPELVAALGDENNTLRNTVSNILEKHGAAAIYDLMNGLKSENSHSRNESAALLGRAGDRAAIPEIISGLRLRRINPSIAASALSDLSAEIVHTRRSAIGEITLAHLRSFHSAIVVIAKAQDEEARGSLIRLKGAYERMASRLRTSSLSPKYSGARVPPRFRAPRRKGRQASLPMKPPRRMAIGGCIK